MKLRTRCAGLTLALVTLASGGRLAAQAFHVDIFVNELGQGRLTNTTGFDGALPFSMEPDGGPGGLSLAATFGLLSPPGLVGGDLLLYELLGGPLSDVIRFNPATGTLVFYSDHTDPDDNLPADTGFPTAFWANTFSALEVGPEGANGYDYTPTEGMPGYVAGAAGPVTYHITSDISTVPEPGTLALLGTGLTFVTGGTFARRKRRSA